MEKEKEKIITNKKFKETKGHLIKRIRLINGITQTQMAKRLGVIQSNVSRWENGEVEPSDLTMAKIQKKFIYPDDAYDYINGRLPGQQSMFD